jgi:hypothetical protein
LIIVADGVGVGVGVGDGDGEGVGVGEAVGVGVGVGVGVNCACADDTPTARTKTMAASRANARPALILSARDEQRMNSIPEISARSKNAQNADPLAPICAEFAGSVNRLRSRPRTEYGPLLFGGHMSRTLRMPGFRVAIRGAIGF